MTVVQQFKKNVILAISHYQSFFHEGLIYFYFYYFVSTYGDKNIGWVSSIHLTWSLNWLNDGITNTYGAVDHCYSVLLWPMIGLLNFCYLML